MFEIVMIAIIVAGVAGAYFRWMGALPINVTQTLKMSTFDVTGEGKVIVAPDQATISMGVSETGNSLKEVQNAVNTKMTNLSKSLKELGVEAKDIQTTNYNYYPDYQYKNTYHASSSVSVVVKDLDKVSPALDLITKLGLDNVSGPVFGLSDSLNSKSMKEARALAIDKAKTKAEELASLSGMKLGRIMNVSESNLGYSMPMNARVDNVMMDKSVETTTPVEPGSSEVNVSITLSFETR